MFWEISGIGTEVILSRVIYFLIVPSESLLFSALVYLTLLLVSVSCF